MAEKQLEFEPVVSAEDTDGALAATPGRKKSWYRSDDGEVASWLIIMAGLALAAAAAVVALSAIFAQLTDNVAAAVDGELAAPGTAPGGGTTGEGANNPDGTAKELPVRTQHCSVTITGSLGAFGIEGNAAVSGEVIIQTMPDGTRIVTIGGDLAGSGATGPAPVGAGVTVNDSTIGAYASAAAEAWGSVGGGVQYEVAPGDSVGELLVGLGIAASPGASAVSGGINWFFPDTIPTAPPPDTVYVDVDRWVAAGGTAQAGIGIVSVGANAGGEAGINQTYAIHSDGTTSTTTTFHGELSGDAGVTGGIPFFAWGSASVAGEAQGAIAVQTIYDENNQPVEAVITTTYGYDGDAILGSDDDNLSITTQQWTLDLTDPEVREAFESLDAFVPDEIAPLPTDIPTQLPTTSWDILSENANTTGAVTQTLDKSEIDVNAELGAGVAGGSGGVNGNCTDLQ